jgi:hypothetical protein
MDTKILIDANSQKQPLFHPSVFENSEESLPAGQRTLQMIAKERGQRLAEEDITKLVSPGEYPLTPDDTKLAQSNTRFLFKNLYGETPLTFLFFSDVNVENIQKLLRMNVYKQMGYVIDNQSVNELLIIMRSIFLEYAAHPALIDETMSDIKKKELLLKYKKEVVRLNDIVIDEILPKLISQIQQYLVYLKDASKPAYIDFNPKNESTKGQKEYRSITQVLIGGEL